VQLFNKEPDILAHWRGRIRYLLVDEYQDTNLAQYTLVRQLVGTQGRFTVVGDDDQSIYAWRGARPENLAQLQQDFTNLQVIKLEQNYRSSKRILQAANLLINHNSHIFEKKLWSDLGPGEQIRVLTCENENDEATKIVAEILHHKLITGSTYNYGDYAILYRGNYQARPFEKALQQLNIPYFLSGGTSFFARTEIRDLMAYLRLLVNPEDDAAFLRIVNVPRRNIGPATLERLTAYAHERHSYLLAVCDELGLSNHLEERARWYLGQFATLITTYARKAETDDPAQTVRELITELDYIAWLKETSSNSSTAKRRIANVFELIEWLTRLRAGEYADATLVELIKRLSLFDVLDRQADNEKTDRINLMTLHAAKGLEFSHVFLAGMEEQLLPHRNSIEAEDETAIEEERRLAYVGITRARRSLTLTLANQRSRGNEMINCEPSRFLTELKDAQLLWINKNSEVTKEENRKLGSIYLAEIKNILGE
ncbi:ATP-dependent DNA helicase Rep, partial [Achromatium sp. WMS1]